MIGETKCVPCTAKFKILKFRLIYMISHLRTKVVAVTGLGTLSMLWRENARWPPPAMLQEQVVDR